MEKLAATFTVHLPSRFLVSRPEDEEPRFNVTIDDFYVEIRLVGREPWAHKAAEDEHFTFGVSEVKICVVREERTAPPAPEFTAHGKDWSTQSDYFKLRLPHYQQIAVEALNRLIRFFKYILQNPLLYEFDLRDQDLQNPTWTDETGQEAGRAGVMIIAEAIPGLHPALSTRVLTQDEDANLRSALESAVEPELYEEILSDAQAAIYQNNLRRAILEMAIACEVVVKQTYFAKSTPAGAAFEYLEEKQKVGITVIELIHKVAERAFGESFVEIDKRRHYINIDHLFRCRNKIAHRGELSYKDDKSNTYAVNRDTVIEWWYSLEKLIDWLKEIVTHSPDS